MSVTRETWQKVTNLHSGLYLTLGPNATDRYLLDPKLLGFMFSRYKFAAKMLNGCGTILDIGCGDGMGTLTYTCETMAKVVGVDFDQNLINHANDVLLPAVRRIKPFRASRLTFECVDILQGSFFGNARFNGISCIDVIEHIEESQEHKFLSRLAFMLKEHGIAVIGTPNALHGKYGSNFSQTGHINNYDPDRLEESLSEHFHNVIMFSMNDEMVHTGFDQLAHYLIALCVGPR